MGTWPGLHSGLAASVAMLAVPVAAQPLAVPGGAFAPRSCPQSVADVANCFEAADGEGSFVLAAMPRQWNKTLIVHAHGGPRLAKPKAGDSDEDIDRFSVMVRDGHAWVGSTYRRGGFGVRMAAADVETSRRMFVAHFGKPGLTILHGQSYGGNVAAKLAELAALTPTGDRSYDGVLLTNAVLAGGTRAYRFRADLRAVYQYYCRNHPAPEDAPYPLWQGLPLDAALTRDNIAARMQSCLGTPAARTPEQAARLHNIVGVTGIAEPHLLAHLAFATFSFRDLVMRRLGGRNPFDNSKTVYRGSSDDAALNRDIARFVASPEAVAELAYDADLTGQIILPTVTLNARHDPTIAAAQAGDYARRVTAAGAGHLVRQILTDETEHSRLSDASYRHALRTLIAWLRGQPRPAVQKRDE